MSSSVAIPLWIDSLVAELMRGGGQEPWLLAPWR
jgi:hypothetical protein